MTRHVPSAKVHPATKGAEKAVSMHVFPLICLEDPLGSAS